MRVYGSRALALALLTTLSGCFLSPSQSATYHNGGRAPKPVSYFKAKSLSLSRNTSCAIDLNDSLWCWGDSLGTSKFNSSTVFALTPQRVQDTLVGTGGPYTFSKFSYVAQNETEMCAISKNLDSMNMVVCWGTTIGSVALWDYTNSVAVRATKIALAQGGGCGIDTNQKLFCFGLDSTLRGATVSGSLLYDGINSVSVGGTVAVLDVQAAGTTICMLVQDSINEQDLYCWGQDYFYAMNDSTAELPFVTKVMDGVGEFYLSSGKLCYQPSGVDENGNNWPWQCRGANYENAEDLDGSIEPSASTLSWYVLPDDGTGALALNSDHLEYGAYQVYSPKVVNDDVETVPGFVDPFQYFATLPYGCRVDNGALWCHGFRSGIVGDADLGRTGDATTSVNDWTPISTSAMTGSDRRVKRFALGLNHGCLISENDYVHCWGSNQQGQLGTGTSLPMYLTREPHPLPIE